MRFHEEELPYQEFERTRAELQKRYEGGEDPSPRDIAYQNRMKKIDKLIALMKDKKSNGQFIHAKQISNKVKINPEGDDSYSNGFTGG